MKRKKHRRKARRASAPRKPDSAPEESSASEEDEDSDEDGTGDGDDDNNRNGESVSLEHSCQPSKKRRRGVSEGPDSGDSDSETCDSENKEPPSVQRPLAKLTGTLPSFPSPSVPDAPPRSMLAIQGIDKALIHAEIIDPATVTSLTTAEQDHDTGLSLKTRRRLLDLGISELFAGQSKLRNF